MRAFSVGVWVLATDDCFRAFRWYLPSNASVLLFNKGIVRKITCLAETAIPHRPICWIGSSNMVAYPPHYSGLGADCIPYRHASRGVLYEAFPGVYLETPSWDGHEVADACICPRRNLDDDIVCTERRHLVVHVVATNLWGPKCSGDEVICADPHLRYYTWLPLSSSQQAANRCIYSFKWHFLSL